MRKHRGMTLIEIIILVAIIVILVAIVAPSLGGFWHWIQSTLFS